MRSNVALVIGAAAAALFGLALVLAPASMLAGFGLGTPPEGIVLSRDVGATLLGLAVLNWLGRDATGRALRAILIGNVVIQALELAVNGFEIASGVLPGQAAPGLVIHLVLGGIFLSALTRSEGAG